MSALRDRALFATFAVLQCFVLCGLAVAARAGARPSALTLGLAFSFLPYAGALFSARGAFDKRTLDAVALWLTLAFGAAFIVAPPVLSDDLYRYLWEGKLWLEGLNPYRLPPDDPSLTHLRDSIWASINNKPLATIYPPLSQLLFMAAAWMGGGVWTVKLLALVAHEASVLVVARSSREPRAALAIGLNPLLLGEGALNGHFDVLMGAMLLCAAWAMTRHRFVQAGFAVCGAVGLKLVGLVVLPLLWRRRGLLLGTAFGSALMLAPLVLSRTLGDPASGPGQFATRWRGNESLFALADFVARLFPEDVQAIVARALVAIALLTVIGIAVHRRLPALQASRAIVWAVLLLSPQVHPWYLGWLLPLEVAAGARAGIVWSAAVLCAYAPLDRWVVEGRWEMPLWLQIAEYGVVLLALVGDPRRPSLRRHGSEDNLPSDSKKLE